MFINRVYNITGAGSVLVGKIVEGTLFQGMSFEVNRKIMQVRSIEFQHKVLEQANVGDDVAISVNGGDYRILKTIEKQKIRFFSIDLMSKKFNEQMPKANKPKTFFDTIKSIFGK